MLLSIEQRAVIVLILKLLMVLIIVAIGEILIGGLLTNYYRNKRVMDQQVGAFKKQQTLPNSSHESTTRPPWRLGRSGSHLRDLY